MELFYCNIQIPVGIRTQAKAWNAKAELIYNPQKNRHSNK